MMFYVKCASLICIFLNFRFQSFRSSLQSSFSAAHTETLPLSTIVENLNKSYADAEFSQSEIDAAVERMTNDNHIMVSEGNVFLV